MSELPRPFTISDGVRLLSISVPDDCDLSSACELTVSEADDDALSFARALEAFNISPINLQKKSNVSALRIHNVYQIL